MTKLLTALFLCVTALTANAMTVITNEEASEVCEALVQAPITQAQIKVYSLTRQRTSDSAKAYYAAVRFPGVHAAGMIANAPRYKFFELLDATSIEDVTKEVKARCVVQVQGNNTAD